MDLSQSVPRHRHLLLHRARHSIARSPRIRPFEQRSVQPTASIQKRIPDSTSSSTTKSSCVSSQTSDTCQKPTNMTPIMPIVLGITVPIVAIVVFIYLHRQYKKRLRQEDRADAEKYKSMDFGMDLEYQNGKKGKGGAPSNPRQMKGLSLDPASQLFFENGPQPVRTPTDSILDDGRYRQANSSRPTSPKPRGRAETDSTLASKSIGHDYQPNSSLLKYAQSTPASVPPRGDSMARGVVPAVVLDDYDKPLPVPEAAKIKNEGLAAPDHDVARDSYFEKNASAMRKSNNYLQAFFQTGTDSSGKDTLVKDDKSMEDRTRESAPNSAASTVVDSMASYKTPITSISDVESLPPMAEPRHAELPDPPTQPSVERRVPSMPLQPRHKSFEASFYEYAPSVASEATYSTDMLRAPRESAQTLPPVPAMRESSQALPPVPTIQESAQALPHVPAIQESPDLLSPPVMPAAVIPPRGQSLTAAMPIVDEAEPDANTDDELDDYMSQYQDDREEDFVPNNRLSVFMRPLPPDDPNDTPDERANRIRSFYKEYFDHTKPHTTQAPLPSQSAEYYEDYGSEYLNGGTLYDAQSGGFVVAAAPYAEPVTRRAMTPPPRAPPRFQSRSRSRAPSGNGQYLMPPRGQSAMSGRSSPRRPAAPPQPLSSLPTPHKLKDDNAIYTAIDFAPPISFRDRQAGRRPDSPMGVQRPYSPAVRAHVPLASSFDDLSNIPSPHMLRKSGLYTNLDFAPPTRFKNTDAGSDVSSLRSGRGGAITPHHLHNNIRAGAYRMSRIPKALAGTKDDIMSELKPTWDLRAPP